MKWQILKAFEFSYGHRVWTQQLNGEYSADLKSACRHLHGHEGKLLVYLTADKLDNTGMITDFRHLEWLKKWINENIDHQFIIDLNDPLYPRLVGDLPLVDIYVPNTNFVAGKKINLEAIDRSNLEIYEMFEGFFIVDFVPTSENLSAWMSQVVDVKMKKLGVRVSQIDWHETPKSMSSFVNIL